jgi:hypothetical protein
MANDGYCGVPCDNVPNANYAPNKYLGKHAAAPIGAKSGLQAWRHLVHALARRQLSADREWGAPDRQYATPCLKKPQ